MSDADDLDNLPPAISVQVTRQGGLGANPVGVMGVFEQPERGQISIAGNSASVRWEAVHFVKTGEQVMADQRCYDAVVEMPFGRSLGAVGFQQAQSPTLNGQPWPKDTAVLDGDDGSLRVLDGEDIQKAWELRTLAWHPDEVHATLVDVELLPLKLPREWLKPVDIGHVQLAIGSNVTVGPAKAEVLAVEGRTKLHPPRIIFRLSLSR